VVFFMFFLYCSKYFPLVSNYFIYYFSHILGLSLYLLVWLLVGTLTEALPCFSLSFKAHVRVKFAKTRHGPHSSKLVVICVVLLLLCCSVICHPYCCTVHFVESLYEPTNALT